MQKLTLSMEGGRRKGSLEGDFYSYARRGGENTKGKNVLSDMKRPR